ncbi:MAG: hypothetical protein ACTHJL_01925 [Amnibacterium sp.]
MTQHQDRPEGVSALERLRRWEAAGGEWHVVRLSPAGAKVELERCDLGEVVDSITSDDPEFLAHLEREG